MGLGGAVPHPIPHNFHPQTEMHPFRIRDLTQADFSVMVDNTSQQHRTQTESGAKSHGWFGESTPGILRLSPYKGLEFPELMGSYGLRYHKANQR